jgi:hypothetical protein
MSADSFTEVTSQSWFGRIGGAIKGVLIGAVLVILSIVALFWNEGRAVKRYKTLKEGGGAVVSVPVERVDSANEGKLVHVTGRADTKATLTDPVFGISANALILKRSAQMYQWKEESKKTTKKKVGGGTTTTTTYNYRKTWSDHVIDSSNFKNPEGHDNPGTMPHSSDEWISEDVSLGAFRLTPSLVRKIGGGEALSVGGDAKVPAALPATAKIHGGGFYIGKDPASPKVGDIRVSFKVVTPTDVSVIAQQVRETFEPYRAKAGGTIELLQRGTHSSDAMIQKAQESNKRLTWILRVVGFIVMLVGWNMIFRPLSVLADVLPLLGSIVGAGTGLVAFMLSVGLWLVTVAIAWIVYRPLLGGILIAAAVASIVVMTMKIRSKKTVAAA